MSRSKKRLNKYFLLLLLLGVSVGFALLSTTLKINGIAGVKGSTYDIHWENVQPNANSTVEAEKPEIDTTRTIVSYEVNLELPGDFYEFDVDAKNDGTIAGTITDIRHSMKKVVEEGQDSTVPDYIKYSVVYKGTSINPKVGDVLGPGDKQTYTVRVEYDKNATTIPDEDITIRIEDEFDYGQEDTRGKYKITFDSDGGTTHPTAIYIEQGNRIGALPPATKDNNKLIGWYKSSPEEKITPAFIPENDMVVTAHWTSSYATFLPGSDVNTKLKSLAGNTDPTSSDTYITSIEKSDTAPTEGTITENLAIEGSTPILAWFDNGVIKLYSEADYLYLNENASNMFGGLSKVTSIYTNYNTSNTTNMSEMFASDGTLSSIDLTSFDTSNVTNMEYMFANTSNLTFIDVTNFSTSNVTSMTGMFINNINLETLNVSNFDTAKVENMSSMFSNCSKITSLDLSNFNTSNVTNMSSMLSSLSSIKTINISNFDFSKYNPGYLMMNITSGGLSSLNTLVMDNAILPQNMNYGFGGLYNLKTISLDGVDTKNVTNMSEMFNGDYSIEELCLNSFDTKNVTNMSSMFYGMRKLTTISVGDSFVVDGVTSSTNMFSGDNLLVGGAGTTYNYNHVDKEYAHYDGGESNPGYFNKKYVSYNIVTFNANGGVVVPKTRQIGKNEAIGTLPTPTRRGYKFIGWYTDASQGTIIDEEYIPSKNVTIYAHWEEIEAMFDVGRKVNTKIKHLAGTDTQYEDAATSTNETVTSILRSQTPAPQGATTDIISTADSKYPITVWIDNNIVYWYTQANKVYTNENASYMLSYFEKATQIDVDFDTSLTTNMEYMLGNNKSVESFDVSGWDTSNVTTMQWLFYKDESIEELDLSTFNTYQVQDMSSIVGDMYSLKTLDMSNFDFTRTNGSSLISNITAGTYSYIKKLKMDNAIFRAAMNSAFANMDSLEEISLKNVDTSRTYTMESMFYDSNKLKHLDLSSFDTSHVGTMQYMFYDCTSLEDINLTGWNTTNVGTMYRMFENCSNLKSLDLSGFDVSHMTHIPSYMLRYCYGLETLNLSGWDLSNYTNGSIMSYLGGDFARGEGKLKYLILDNVKLPNNLNYGFGGLYSVKAISLRNVDTSNVTNMSALFQDAKGLTELDISSFDTRNVTDMSSMFYLMDNIEKIYVGNNFNVNGVTSSNSMFTNDSNLVGEQGTVYDSSHVDKEYAHIDEGQSNPGYLTEAVGDLYTVTFEGNNGRTIVDNIQVRAGKNVAILPTPVRIGYTFDGWYTGLTDGVKVTETYQINSNISLYARWTPNE